MSEQAYSKTARYYDRLYAWKDYAGEVERLISLLHVPPGSKERTLLDVACGTGLHLEHMVKHFQVEGLDICPELLAIALPLLTRLRWAALGYVAAMALNGVGPLLVDGFDLLYFKPITIVLVRRLQREGPLWPSVGDS